jgi:hypothetical protein
MMLLAIQYTRPDSGERERERGGVEYFELVTTTTTTTSTPPIPIVCAVDEAAATVVVVVDEYTRWRLVRKRWKRREETKEIETPQSKATGA